MKTAIALPGNSQGSMISKHFGRCAWFCLFDESTGATEWIENPGRLVEGCKGEPIVAMLVEKGVNRIIAGDFGTIVQQLLNQHQIQMIIQTDSTITAETLIKRMMHKPS